MSEVKKNTKPMTARQLKREQAKKDVAQLFEKMRVKAVAVEQRQRYMDQFLTQMGEAFAVKVLSPINARAFETVCKQGTPEQRAKVMQQLKPKLGELLLDKYARFTAAELLNVERDGEAAAALIREVVVPQAVVLLQNATANIALNMIYVTAPPTIQAEIVNAILTKTASPEPDYAMKQVATLPQSAVMFAKNAAAVLEKCERKMLLGSIVCVTLLCKVLQMAANLPHEDLKSQVLELFAFLTALEADQFLQLIDTKEGAEVAFYIWAMSDAKTKKQIVQRLRPELKKIWGDMNAYAIFFAAILFTDDTVLVKQSFEPLFKLIVDGLGKGEAKADTRGELLLFICLSGLTGLQSTGSCPGLVDEHMASVLRITFNLQRCKKPVEKRQAELAAIVSELLVERMSDAVVLSSYLRSKGLCGELIGLIAEKLPADVLGDAVISKGEQEILCLENSGHFNVKKLLKGAQPALKDALRPRILPALEGCTTKRAELLREWIQ